MPRALHAGSYLEIVNQPVEQLRYRYRTDNANAKIRGQDGGKSWPTLKVHGYEGEGTLWACLVTTPEQTNVSPKVHPHRLEGTNTEGGAYRKRFTITQNNNQIIMDDVNLEQSKQDEWDKEIQIRKDMGLDPFRAGFDHKEKTKQKEIDPMMVAICFTFIVKDDHGTSRPLCTPVTSQPIVNSKKREDLAIVHIMPNRGLATGKGRMIILMNGVTKKEEVTRVDFFGEINGQEWRARGSFTTEKHIHETSAIRLVYPEYKPHNFPENHRRVSVQLVLKRGGKEYKSKPVDFFYLPVARVRRPRGVEMRADNKPAASATTSVGAVPAVLDSHNSDGTQWSDFSNPSQNPPSTRSNYQTSAPDLSILNTTSTSSLQSRGAAQQPQPNVHQASQPSEAHHSRSYRAEENFYSGPVSKPVAATSSDTEDEAPAPAEDDAPSYMMSSDEHSPPLRSNSSEMFPKPQPRTTTGSLGASNQYTPFQQQHYQLAGVQQPAVYQQPMYTEDIQQQQQIYIAQGTGVANLHMSHPVQGNINLESVDMSQPQDDPVVLIPATPPAPGSMQQIIILPSQYTDGASNIVSSGGSHALPEQTQASHQYTATPTTPITHQTSVPAQQNQSVTRIQSRPIAKAKRRQTMAERFLTANTQSSALSQPVTPQTQYRPIRPAPPRNTANQQPVTALVNQSPNINPAQSIASAPMANLMTNGEFTPKVNQQQSTVQDGSLDLNDLDMTYQEVLALAAEAYREYPMQSEPDPLAQVMQMTGVGMEPSSQDGYNNSNMNLQYQQFATASSHSTSDNWVSGSDTMTVAGDYGTGFSSAAQQQTYLVSNQQPPPPYPQQSLYTGAQQNQYTAALPDHRRMSQPDYTSHQIIQQQSNNQPPRPAIRIPASSTAVPNMGVNRALSEPREYRNPPSIGSISNPGSAAAVSPQLSQDSSGQELTGSSQSAGLDSLSLDDVLEVIGDPDL